MLSEVSFVFQVETLNQIRNCKSKDGDDMEPVEKFVETAKF